MSGGAALALSGCGENRLAQTLVEAYRLTVGDHPNPGISRDSVGKLPYASITAKIGKGPRGLLILWRQEGDDLHWLSADGVVLVTRFGRIVKTAGLPETMRDTLSQDTDPVAAGLHLSNNLKSYRRTVDFEIADGNRLLLEIESEFATVRRENIKIVEIDFDTIAIMERGKGKTTNWSFENRYWVDPADGFVWRSSQWIARGFPPIVLEIAKPAAT